MTVQNALLFLSVARADEVLRSDLRARQDDVGALFRLAGERGLDFDENDLQQAFRHDWALRALRERKAPVAVSDPPVSSARSTPARPTPSRS
ncbi:MULTISPECIES: hypothetical protein [unclassified Sphingomonas]|uniref:hypothetical protein n=1 Tax=unclassified Sphingomonas TaxID=196159 RepID=UPI0012E3746C|nr:MULTISPECIES: hypothetical protein [unclassified Sphingomonas]